MNYFTLYWQWSLQILRALERTRAGMQGLLYLKEKNRCFCR